MTPNPTIAALALSLATSCAHFSATANAGDVPQTSNPTHANQADPRAGAAGSPTRPSESELFTLLNAERVKLSLPPLAWSEAAAEVARSHSEDMRSRGAIGHDSPTTGSPADRVKHAGISAGVTSGGSTDW